jgi:hypothetical protein
MSRQSTIFGGGCMEGFWWLDHTLRIDGMVGVDLSDDFEVARHLSMRAVRKIEKSITLFTGLSQHQNHPSRFETHAGFAPGEHYLPYDPLFYQYPELSVKGNSDLDNETISNIFAGVSWTSKLLKGELAYTAYAIQDPLRWQVINGVIEACNVGDENNQGILGWFVMNPFDRFEVGGTGSFLPLESGERRLFPEVIGHGWVQYRHLLAGNNLDMRLRAWTDFWGQRWLPVEGGWKKTPDDLILSARLSARLYGFFIYWGVNNILDRDYELIPGHLMMHKEEVWGISWNFIH